MFVFSKEGLRKEPILAREMGVGTLPITPTLAPLGS